MADTYEIQKSMAQKKSTRGELVKEAGEEKEKLILKPGDEEKIGKALMDEKVENVAKSLKGMKYLYANQVLLIKGMLDRKVETISSELSLDKGLVKDVANP